MKKYEEFELQLITVTMQDIITMSPFDGEDDEFENPNPNATPNPAGNF